MESRPDQPPLIVIVGETASGKSALALQLAEQLNGEVICADSRTIYKGMDIGTAKPGAAAQQRIPHHLLDIITPGTAFTAADFKKLANVAITDIYNRQKLPILVGGTGLYIDAVIYDFSFGAKADSLMRQRLQQLDVVQLQNELHERNIPLPSNTKNPRHLIRLLETGGQPARQDTIRPNTLVIGLQADREVLKERIRVRLQEMFSKGLASEVQYLADTYGWDVPAMRTIGYQEFRLLHKDVSEAEVRAEIEKNTLQYAKRQRTWFKRNKSVHWICQKEEIVELITTLLNKSV